MGIAELSPEERASLKAELDSFQEPEDPIKTLATVIDVLCEKGKEMEDRIASLEDFIQNGLIGGLNTLASEKARADSISGLKGKYGEMFSPYSDFIKANAGEDGIWDLIHDHLESIKGVEGYDEGGSVKEIAEAIGKRVSELSGKPATVEAAKVEEKPPEAPAEESPPAEEEDDMKPVKEYIKKLKSTRSGWAA